MKKLLSKISGKQAESGTETSIQLPVKAPDALGSFGVELGKLIIKDEKTGDFYPPRVLQNLVEFLSQQECLRMEGLFRQPGMKRVIKDVRQVLDADARYDLFKFSHDCFAIATVFKQWIKEVPGGLIPVKYLISFMALDPVIYASTVKFSMKKIIDTFPDEVYFTLRYILTFFRHCSKYKESTKLTFPFLSMALASNLFPSNSTGIFSNLIGNIEDKPEVVKMCTLVNLMLENFDELFLQDEGPTPAEERISKVDEFLKKEMMMASQEKLSKASGSVPAVTSESTKSDETPVAAPTAEVPTVPATENTVASVESPPPSPTTAQQQMIDELQKRLSGELPPAIKPKSTDEVAKPAEAQQARPVSPTGRSQSATQLNKTSLASVSMLQKMEKKLMNIKYASAELMNKTKHALAHKSNSPRSESPVPGPQTKNTMPDTAKTSNVIPDPQPIVKPETQAAAVVTQERPKNETAQPLAIITSFNPDDSISQRTSLSRKISGPDSPKSIMKKRSVSQPPLISPKSVRFDPEQNQVQTFACDSEPESSANEETDTESESVKAGPHENEEELIAEANRLSSFKKASNVYSSIDLMHSRSPRSFEFQDEEPVKEIVIEVDSKPARVPAVSGSVPISPRLSSSSTEPRSLIIEENSTQSPHQHFHTEVKLADTAAKIGKMVAIQGMLKRPVTTDEPRALPHHSRPTSPLKKEVKFESSESLSNESSPVTPSIPTRPPPKKTVGAASEASTVKTPQESTALFDFIPTTFFNLYWDEGVKSQNISMEDRQALREQLKTVHKGLKEFQEYLNYVQSTIIEDDEDVEQKQNYFEMEVKLFRNSLAKFKRLKAYLKPHKRSRTAPVGETHFGDFATSPITPSSETSTKLNQNSIYIGMPEDQLKREKHLLKKEMFRLKTELAKLDDPKSKEKIHALLKKYHFNYKEIKAILASSSTDTSAENLHLLSDQIPSPLSESMSSSPTKMKSMRSPQPQRAQPPALSSQDSQTSLLDALKQEKSRLQSLMSKYDTLLQQETTHQLS